MKKYYVSTILIVILILGLGFFWHKSVQAPATNNLPVACTMEAKICPDGSSVGRIGPKCEFAPCPKTTTLNTPVPSVATTSIKTIPANTAITQDYNGKTIYIKKGDRFLLNLGELNWNISITDQTIISRVKNIMVIKGAQGIYTAEKIGTTVLSAEGRPFCNAGEMCAQFIVNFKVTIVVE